MTPQIILASILILAVAGAWLRLALWRGAAPKGSRGAVWRFALMIALQPVCAGLLFFGLFPPGVRTASGELVVATADTPARLTTTGRVIVLPEARPVADAEMAPDLATALRRHPEIRSIRVLGRGLTARDRDAARGLAIRFEPSAGPSGLVGLSAPPRVAPGADFQVGGQVAGVTGASVELVDPAGRITDVQKIGDDGRFVLTGTVRSQGLATFTVRVKAGGRTLEEAALPVRVEGNGPPRVLILAGAPGPEVKYLRRWATDAGFVVTTQVTAGGGVDLGDAPIAINSESLKRFDVAVIDDRSWAGLGGGRGAVLGAVQGGMGLILRSGGGADEAGRSQWRALGFGVSGGGETVPVALPPATEAAITRTRRGIPAADAPVDLNADDAFLPEIGRLAVGLGGEGTIPLLRDAGGASLSAWRPSGRGRIAVFTGVDSFALALVGRSDLYGDWWGGMVSTVARPVPGAQAAFDGPAWVGDRISLCAVAADPRVEAPGGGITRLQPDPAAQGCAGFWPTQAGWHGLRSKTAEGAEQVWSYYVHPAEKLAGVRAARDRDATLMLTGKPATGAAASGPEVPGSPWPWLAVWLVVTTGLWWLERSARGRAGPPT